MRGQDHPDVADSYNNIGTVYYSQVKYEEALVQHRRALEIETRVLGQDHPSAATSPYNMACEPSVYHTSQLHLYAYLLPLPYLSIGT